MDLFWRGIVLYFQELKSSLVPQDTIFFPSLWGWEDNEGVPFSGRKWWCYQIVTGKPMAWNVLHVSVVSLYLRTSRVTGSPNVWLAHSVRPCPGRLYIITYSYFKSQDSPLQWSLSSFDRTGNGSSGKISNLLDIAATVWGGIRTQGCLPHCTLLFQLFFSIVWLHDLILLYFYCSLIFWIGVHDSKFKKHKRYTLKRLSSTLVF